MSDDDASMGGDDCIDSSDDDDDDDMPKDAEACTNMLKEKACAFRWLWLACLPAACQSFSLRHPRLLSRQSCSKFVPPLSSVHHQLCCSADHQCPARIHARRAADGTVTVWYLDHHCGHPIGMDNQRYIRLSWYLRDTVHILFKDGLSTEQVRAKLARMQERGEIDVRCSGDDLTLCVPGKGCFCLQ